MSEWSAEALERYWQFIAERQRIWRQRVMGVKPPWTDDPILGAYHFTNVYRELDPGTTFAKEAIIYARKPASERLFNLLLYRLIGREETYKALGWVRPGLAFRRERFYDALAEVRRRGEPVFTGSYMVNGYHWMGTKDKIENITRLIEEVCGLRDKYDQPGVREDAWGAAVAEIERLRSLNQPARARVHEILSNLNGWGGFLAYQVMVDLSYPAERLWPSPAHVLPEMGDNDGWVFLGSGAVKGLNVLAGRETRRPEHQALIAELQERTNQALDNLGFNWLARLTGGVEGDLEPIPLSKANILNCCCEFFKYDRASRGGQPPRMRYAVPREAPEPLRPGAPEAALKDQEDLFPEATP